VLCLHRASFTGTAAAIYQAMGFERAPAFDFTPSDYLGIEIEAGVRVIAYRLDL
jgi:hypothetical protein